MSVANREPLIYHVHVYFDDATEAEADTVYQAAADRPEVSKLGRFHPKPIGPHPCRQFQMLVNEADLESLVSWVDENRRGLDVLIHPEIENDYVAHTTEARWLGHARTLKLDGLSGAPKPAESH